MLVKTNYQ